MLFSRLNSGCTLSRICLGFVLGIGLCLPLSAEDDWKVKLQGILDEPTYTQSHWGVLAADQATGEVLFEHDAHKLFAPASVTKLYSVAAALDELGADFRFETPIYRRGEVNAAGQLDGDLILVATGDLTLGGRTTAEGKISFRNSDHTYANGVTTAQITDEDPLAGLRELAKQVAAAGIKSVKGDVLIDDRLFDRAESTGSGPALVSPVSLNDNLVDVVVTPASEIGTQATFEWRPQTTLLNIDCVVQTVAADAKPDVSITWAGPGRVVVRGQIPLGQSPLLRVADWSDPEFYVRGCLIEELGRAGVQVQSSRFAAPAAASLPPQEWYAAAAKVATLQSPPFSENAKLILKVSHNLHASTLPLLIAAKHGERTLAAGLKREGEFLQRAGVDLSTISFGGGAGGSRADFTTPTATVQLLRHMSTRPDFAAYNAALPVLGMDGTLATVVDESSPARGKVQAKTGTFYLENSLNGRWLLTSKALAGYVDAASGRQVVLAVFVNGTHLGTSDETKREGRTLGRIAETIQQGL